jgi:hypothetical protein
MFFVMKNIKKNYAGHFEKLGGGRTKRVRKIHWVRYPPITLGKLAPSLGLSIIPMNPSWSLISLHFSALVSSAFFFLKIFWVFLLKN